MAIVPYKLNEKDKLILQSITTKIKQSLDAWYGEGVHLDGSAPEIRSYRF